MHTQLYTLVSGLMQEGGCNGLILLGKLIYFWQFVLIINGVTLVTCFMLNNKFFFLFIVKLPWEMAGFFRVAKNQNKEAGIPL